MIRFKETHLYFALQLLRTIKIDNVLTFVILFNVLPHDAAIFDYLFETVNLYQALRFDRMTLSSRSEFSVLTTALTPAPHQR